MLENDIKEQLCHVNMIKIYHSRVPNDTEKQVHNLSLVVNTSDNDNTLDSSEIGHDVILKCWYLNQTEHIGL